MSYNNNGDVLAQGKSCIVKISVNSDAGAGAVPIGFVESWTVRRSYQTQKAEVVGRVAPVSIDVVSVDVTVTLSGFIPSASILPNGIKTQDGGGTYYIKQLMPKPATLEDASALQKIPYMAFVDKDHEDNILSSVKWLTPAENSESSQGKSFLKTDATFQAISAENGSSYAELA